MHKTANASADTYKLLRAQARELVLADMASILPAGVALTDLNEDALNQADRWGGFTWGYIARKFRRRPRRIEVAIWFDEVLCGIACGRISNQKVIASIHYLESNPSSHPLRGLIAPIATRFLDTAGVLAGCKEASINNPVEPLVDFYKALGYVKENTKGKKITRLYKSLT